MSTNLLENVKNASEALCSIASLDCTNSAIFNDVVSKMHDLCNRIYLAEACGYQKQDILIASKKAREAHGKSPFLLRLQSWPRGYQGDFETIEFLLNQQVTAQEHTLEYWLEYYAIGSLMAQQHRNKILAQASEITRVLSTTNNPQLLIFASGSSPDLAHVQRQVHDTECRILINDADRAAIEYSLKRLCNVEHRINAVHGNALTSISKLLRFGPFDLIVAGGLFDYLNDRQAKFLLNISWKRLLKPNGRFFFTNVSSKNPFRIWMEYMADWTLIERSKSDIVSLIEGACSGNNYYKIEPDPTLLSWLVTLQKIT